MPLFDTEPGFITTSSAIESNIYLPRYYSPAVRSMVASAHETFELVSMGEIEDNGWLSMQSGHDIGKLSYGGAVPFIRTSDIAGLEVVGHPTQAVSPATFEQWATKQDLQPGDLLFVKDGLYLIGSTALVTARDVPALFQSHLLRMRVSGSSDVPKWLRPGSLLLLLNTDFVRAQARSKQFTAGIIDKIEHRYRELMLPIPPSSAGKAQLATRGERMEAIGERRGELRAALFALAPRLQGTAEGQRPGSHLQRQLGFRTSYRSLGTVLLPKYSSPDLDDELAALAPTHDLVSLGSLEDKGDLVVSGGVEVGKLAYGTGSVSFVRTSDISDLEVTTSSKQTVSESVYGLFKSKADLRDGDVLLVRDGTYLVGTSAIVGPDLGHALHAGGVLRLRTTTDELTPELLTIALNTPIVQAQIRSKQFTRDVIDTLGNRWREVVLPLPKTRRKREAVTSDAAALLQERWSLRSEARTLIHQTDTAVTRRMRTP